MGVPKWMVYRENPNPKWMITTGTPILGNLHIYAHQSKILSYPRVFHFYGNFPYEPSILGYPHFRNPYIYIYEFGTSTSSNIYKPARNKNLPTKSYNLKLGHPQMDGLFQGKSL